MSVRDSGDEQTERAWHFIGRAYVCYKGGSKHEHLSADDYFKCARQVPITREDMTKNIEDMRRNIEDMRRNNERRNSEDMRRNSEDMKRNSEDMKRRQAHEQLLKDKDLRMSAEKTQRVRMMQDEATKRLNKQHDHEIKMKLLELGLSQIYAMPSQTIQEEMTNISRDNNQSYYESNNPVYTEGRPMTGNLVLIQ